MSKKKIIIIALCVILIIISLVFLTKYILLKNKVNNLNKEVQICKDKFYKSENYYGSAKCFADIVNITGRVEYKYYQAIALFNMQEYDKAKKELKIIVDNSSEISNKKLVDKTKMIYDFLSSTSEKEIINSSRIALFELNEQNSLRLDIGDYYSDLKKIALWENPKKITVYIENDEKKDIFKKAFKLWSKALGSTVTFILIKQEENADIICKTVDKLSDMRLGSTSTSTFKKNGKTYINHADITIALNDPFEGEKLEDESILSTTLHEIGHAIGIISHSPQKGDVMYVDSSGYRHEKSQISNRDINTVKKIYGNI